MISRFPSVGHLLISLLLAMNATAQPQMPEASSCSPWPRRQAEVPFTQVSEGTTVKSQTVKFEAAGTASFSLPPGHAP